MLDQAALTGTFCCMVWQKEYALLNKFGMYVSSCGFQEEPGRMLRIKARDVGTSRILSLDADEQSGCAVSAHTEGMEASI